MQITDTTDAANPLLAVVDSQPDGTVFVKGNTTLICLNLAGMIFVSDAEQGTYDMSFYFFLYLSGFLQKFSLYLQEYGKGGNSIDKVNNQ